MKTAIVLKDEQGPIIYHRIIEIPQEIFLHLHGLEMHAGEVLFSVQLQFENLFWNDYIIDEGALVVMATLDMKDETKKEEIFEAIQQDDEWGGDYTL